MKNTLIKFFTGLVALLLLVTLLTSCTGQKPKAQNNDMVLWYKQPAEKWNDGLLIGNGYMGANVFGGVQNERISLNESSFWSGYPHDYNNPEAFTYFPKIRDLVFSEKFQEAEEMTNDHFWGIPMAQQFFQPLGDLLLNFKEPGKVTAYNRELNLETGIARITYTIEDVKFIREVFMSYPDHVMVLKISSNKPGKVSLEAKLKSPFLDQTVAKEGKLLINGTWRYIGSATNNLCAKFEGSGLKFQTALVAIPEKGELGASDSSLVINNANSVTFILTAATSYVNYTDISADPSARVEKVLAALAGKDFKALRRTHETDFSNLMRRVHLIIGDPLLNKKPTDERLAAPSRAARSWRSLPAAR